MRARFILQSFVLALSTPINAPIFIRSSILVPRREGISDLASTHLKPSPVTKKMVRSDPYRPNAPAISSFLCDSLSACSTSLSPWSFCMFFFPFSVCPHTHSASWWDWILTVLELSSPSSAISIPLWLECSSSLPPFPHVMRFCSCACVCPFGGRGHA